MENLLVKSVVNTCFTLSLCVCRSIIIKQTFTIFLECNGHSIDASLFSWLSFWISLESINLHQNNIQPLLSHECLPGNNRWSMIEIALNTFFGIRFTVAYKDFSFCPLILEPRERLESGKKSHLFEVHADVSIWLLRGTSHRLGKRDLAFFTFI